MKKYLIALPVFLLTLLIALFSSCREPEEALPYRAEVLNLPATPFQYADPQLPEHYKQTLDLVKLASITDDGATLGRVLFYDKKLSVNNTISCASCHHQEAAFADPVALSVGFEGQKTTRNALAIANVINQPSFFWDSRTHSIEDLVTQPIRNHIEMGLEDLDELEEKVAAISYYPPLFEKAFGTPEVTRERIASAAGQFMNSMVSADAKFDHISTGQATLTPEESNGQWLFFGGAACYRCHSGTDLRGEPGGFVDATKENWANIGLDESYTDNGLGEGETNSSQRGVFKVPSLRNVALTAPYMHDGRFETLEEVIEHYNSGIQAHPNLDWRLNNSGNPVRMGLSEQNKADLIAFLHTFTDQNLITNPKFSDPFEER